METLHFAPNRYLPGKAISRWVWAEACKHLYRLKILFFFSSLFLTRFGRFSQVSPRQDVATGSTCSLDRTQKSQCAHPTLGYFGALGWFWWEKCNMSLFPGSWTSYNQLSAWIQGGFPKNKPFCKLAAASSNAWQHPMPACKPQLDLWIFMLFWLFPGKRMQHFPSILAKEPGIPQQHPKNGEEAAC